VLRLLGIIIVLVIIFINFDYIYNYKSKKREKIETQDEDSNDSDTMPDKIEISATSYNKYKVNYNYDKKKKKKVKTIQVSLVEEETPFSFFNVFYLHFDIYTNYAVICLIFFIIKDLEKNAIHLIFYIIILLILFIRVKYFVKLLSHYV